MNSKGKYTSVAATLFFQLNTMANKYDYKLQTALTTAVENGDLVQMFHLVKNGANINCDSYPSIIAASKFDQLEMAKELISLGADVKIHHSKALYYAVKNHNFAFVRLLVENGADPYDNTEKDPIDTAVFWGEFEVVAYLVGDRKDYKYIDFRFERPFGSAAYLNDFRLVKFFMEKGVNLSKTKSFALSSAAGKGHLEMVKFLCENGILDSCAYGIHLALSSAAESGHLEVMKYLVEKGADVNYSNGSPLEHAIQRNGTVEVVKYLVEHGAQIIANSGLITYAISRGNFDLVKYLFEQIQTVISQHLLDVCLRYSLYKPEMAEYFIERGATFEGEMDNILFDIGRWGHMDELKFLMEKGIDISQRNNIIFVLAAKHFHIEMVKFLIENVIIGAEKDDALIYTLKGLEYDSDDTDRKNQFEIVKLLVKMGARIHENIENEYSLFSELSDLNWDLLEFVLKNAFDVSLQENKFFKELQEDKRFVENGFFESFEM